MLQWIKNRSAYLWGALAAAIVGLLLIARQALMRAREDRFETALRKEAVDSELSRREIVRLTGEADALRPRREALEATIQKLKARTTRDVSTMTADEIAAEYWRLRSGGDEDSK